MHKNTFGHALILAGSKRMLGAGALASLAAMRCGAGLVTLGVPKSLNSLAQHKVANVVMTWPLPETNQQTLGSTAFRLIKSRAGQYQSIAVGPGLSDHPSTLNVMRKIIAQIPLPMVIDADALRALEKHLNVLNASAAPRILTPHPGEMARLINVKKEKIEEDRVKVAKDFASRHHCTLLLKGHRTVVASPNAKTYMNRTGNPGMATAGSGDVLTGLLAALLAQGVAPTEAAKFGAYLHGKAGDLAAKARTKAGMTAEDIIEYIPKAIKLIRST